jgi:hypothetical protein
MLVSLRLVIRTLIDRMRRVSGADDVPQILGSLRQARGQHPDQSQDEAACRQPSHGRMITGPLVLAVRPACSGRSSGGEKRASSSSVSRRTRA